MIELLILVYITNSNKLRILIVTNETRKRSKIHDVSAIIIIVLARVCLLHATAYSYGVQNRYELRMSVVFVARYGYVQDPDDVDAF